jgi:CubicO group peptidase (beta-lactamase class C family)
MDQAPLMQGFPPAQDRQVTLANWRLPPFNRWGFQHVREILPTASIAGAGRRHGALGRSERRIAKLAFPGPDGKEWTVGRMLPETFTDGFVLMQRGRILAEWYDAGMTPETPHIVFSVSKSLTGALAGILVERGQLDPDLPVTRYIPEAAGSAYGDCTVRHVLDMTVSIEFEENYLDPHGVFGRYRLATGWNPLPEGIKPTDLRSFLVTLKRDKRAHGSLFHYVSPNSDLMGWILERASGVPYAELLSEAIWKPLGTEQDGYVTVDRLGAPRSAGGICVTTRDLARFGEMMRLRGLASGRQIVPGRWIDDITEAGDPKPWQISESGKLFAPEGRYRSKWYIMGYPSGAYCAVGIHGQWIYIDPAADMVIAKHSSQPLPVDMPTDNLLLAAFDALGRWLEKSA